MSVSRNRNARWQKRLRQLAKMRAAKERKRLANPVEREPKMERWYPLEIGFRDKQTGETAWTDFKGIRDTIRRATIVQNCYQPGVRSFIPVRSNGTSKPVGQGSLLR